MSRTCLATRRLSRWFSSVELAEALRLGRAYPCVYAFRQYSVASVTRIRATCGYELPLTTFWRIATNCSAVNRDCFMRPPRLTPDQTLNHSLARLAGRKPDVP